MCRFYFFRLEIEKNCYRFSTTVSKPSVRARNDLKINKIKFESNGDLIDQAYSKSKEALINIQYPHSQIEDYSKSSLF